MTWKNLSDREMVFMTVEFKDSANKPMISARPACGRNSCRHA